MEPKNIVLLGFVKKAIDYLNEHLDEDTAASLAKLKEIDLDSMKEELDEEFNSSLEPLRVTIDALMNSGSKAFDEFVNEGKPEEEKEEDLSSELDRIFDVDLDEDEAVEDKKELEDLLSYYDLNGELEVDEKVLDEEDLPEEKEEEIETRANEESKEEEVPFELDEEEEKLLELIARNVNKKEDEESDDSLSGANHELDSIFSELVAAEDKGGKQEEEIPITINHIQEFIQVPEEEKVSVIENPLVDVPYQDEEEETEPEEVPVEEPEPEKEEEPDPVYPEQVDKDDIIRLIKDIQPISDVYYSDIESPVEEKPAEVKEEKKKDGQYVSSLIDDLKTKLDEEEEKKKAIEENYRKIYEKIHGSYPYLSSAFIRYVYDLKESIAREYPLDVNIVILHRTHFNDVESLRQYVEIALKHDYTINADEKQMIVDAFKPYINTDGKIITSIFEVANQSALLEGEYEGYRVLFEDDLEYKA